MKKAGSQTGFFHERAEAAMSAATQHVDEHGA